MIAKMKAIKPHPLNDEAMSKELRDSTKEFSEYVIKDFDNVTTGWKGSRPKWNVRYWANQYQIGFQVYTDEKSEGGQKWVWLDLGTKKNYPIPKNPATSKTLAFPSIYNAGSRPNQIRTYNASSGGEMRFAKQVIHPGIDARNWTKILQADEQKVFERWIGPTMQHVADVSGHSMEK